MSSTEEIRPARMWRLMPSDLRPRPPAFWSDEQAALEQAEAVALIARQIKFRPKSVLSLPVEKKAGTSPAWRRSRLLAARLLIAYHLEHQRPMMGAFLDALGIAHEDGLIKDESPTAPDAATLDKGVVSFSAAYPKAGRGALFLGAAVAGPRDVGRPYRAARNWPLESEHSGLRGRPSIRHIFICCNRREPGHPRGCCNPDGTDALQKAFKKALAERGLNRRIRANKSGCLDQCEKGPTVVVYPDTVCNAEAPQLMSTRTSSNTSSAAAPPASCGSRKDAHGCRPRRAWCSPSPPSVLEVVLGIDNVIFISILAGKLPRTSRRARRIGLMAAMVMRILLLLSLAWIVRLTAPLFTVRRPGDLRPRPDPARRRPLPAGQGHREIHDKLEGEEGTTSAARVAPSLAAVIAQIMLLDIVFSLDSVITAVGMADDLAVMIAAVVIAVGIMMFVGGRSATSSSATRR